MKYRHEWKHEINNADKLILLSRLPVVMQTDPNAKSGSYSIRSLYFDTPDDKALREKIDGVNAREKFRIRLYMGTGDIFLEKKSKLNGLCGKESCQLTPAETQRIIAGDMQWMADSRNPLLTEFYAKTQSELLAPKTIVDYTRYPFIYAPGNVRVTIDSDIRTGLNCTDLLNPQALTIPAGDSPMLLEVKWDNFLPDIIRDAVSLGNRHVTSFSKYAQCRIYG